MGRMRTRWANIDDHSIIKEYTPIPTFTFRKWMIRLHNFIPGVRPVLPLEATRFVMENLAPFIALVLFAGIGPTLDLVQPILKLSIFKKWHLQHFLNRIAVMGSVSFQATQRSLAFILHAKVLASQLLNGAYWLLRHQHLLRAAQSHATVCVLILALSLHWLQRVNIYNLCNFNCDVKKTFKASVSSTSLKDTPSKSSYTYISTIVVNRKLLLTYQAWCLMKVCNYLTDLPVIM